jgi:hypothetical protein
VTSLISLAFLKARVTDSWAAPEISRDEALALIAAVDAAHKLMSGPGGTPALLNGRNLEAKLDAFKEFPSDGY